MLTSSPNDDGHVGEPEQSGFEVSVCSTQTLRPREGGDGSTYDGAS